MENIERALAYLTQVLRNTRAGSDVLHISVTEDGKAAIIWVAGGKKNKAVSIDGDSAIAAVVDVCRALM